MNLILDADLSCPPSEVYCFRTVCMVADIRAYNVFAEISWDCRDYYFSWFKTHFLFDFVRDLVPPGEVEGGKLNVTRLTCENVKDVIRLI